MKIETDHLIIKKVDMSQVDDYLSFLNRNKEFFKPWEPDRPDHHYTLDIQKAIMTRKTMDFVDERGFKFVFYQKNDPDKIIGDFDFINIMKGPFLSCYLTYKIDHDFVRKGFMTEALTAGIAFLFNEKKMHRIEANVMPWNDASIKLVEKLGFKNEGKGEKYLKINGKWEDHIRYSLLNPKVE